MTTSPIRIVRSTAGVTLALGLAICIVALLSEQLGLGTEEARGMFGWKRISLLFAGLVIAGAGAVLLIRPEILTRPDRWRAFERAARSQDRYLKYLGIGVIGLLGIALVWSRLVNITDSLWHDEVHTVLNYIGVGPGPILFGEGDYSINNHVLYNFLSWLTASVIGGSEATYRIWSVLPAIGAVALATWWAWRRLGALTAIAFLALAVAARQHLELAPQARGYGLALLAATLMLIAADRLTRAYSNRTLIGLAGAGVLGIWTLHVFAVAFIGQVLALFRWQSLRRPAIAALALAGLLSILFYAPVLRDLLAESRPRGETISFSDAVLLNRPLTWLAVPSFIVPFDIAQARWMALPALLLVAFAVASLWRRGESGLALILLAPPLFMNLFISVVGLSTVPRHQFLLMTHVLLLAAIGVAEIGRLIAYWRPLRPAAIAAGVLAALVLAGTAVVNQHRSVPYENFKEAAKVVAWAGVQPVITDTTRPDGLVHYIGRDLIHLEPSMIESFLCDWDRDFIYVRHAAVRLTPGSPDAPARLDCLEDREAVRIRVRQRARGNAIDVWIVNPVVSADPVLTDLPRARESLGIDPTDYEDGATP